MTERARNVQIKFYVTEEEAALLQQKIDKSGKSRRDFFLQLASSGKIVRLDSLMSELKRQGNNLNQLTKVFNTYGDKPLYSKNAMESVRKILEEVGKTWRLLNQFLAVQSNIHLNTSRKKQKPQQN